MQSKEDTSMSSNISKHLSHMIIAESCTCVESEARSREHMSPSRLKSITRHGRLLDHACRMHSLTLARCSCSWCLAVVCSQRDRFSASVCADTGSFAFSRARAAFSSLQSCFLCARFSSLCSARFAS
eukprot:3101113-Pleurochrysis_carterae.AAC.2